MGFIDVNFQPMQRGELEYILEDYFLPQERTRRFQTISPEEAKELYFPREKGKVNVYVVAGGQRGDEAKAKAANLISKIDGNIRWMLAPNSTHNAGKGVWTEDVDGNSVRVGLHVCPEGIVNPEIQNYIGRNTQINLFSLENEINEVITETGRGQLGIDYHLMLDRHANIVIPINRANDIVGAKNAMGSTIVGATDSLKQAIGKNAPFLDDVVYDPESFKKYVNKQIVEFNDKIKHDSELMGLGITDMASFGLALKDETKLKQNRRLAALGAKLREEEIEFFSQQDPAQYLLEQYKEIIEKKLFEVGDCQKEIDGLIGRGYAGVVEGVQSSLLSGGVKFADNRTGAFTHSTGIIGDAGLTSDKIEYRKGLVFKFGNTSVGGTGSTMSGFIRQDALSELKASSPKAGKVIYFEKTAALDEFLTREQISEAFNQVNAAFYNALEKGLSLKHSKVNIKGIDCEFTLAEARALLTAYEWGETGETSKRSRTCKFDDLVATGVVYDIEGDSLQLRNAVDRAIGLEKVGIVTAYHVVKPYRDHQPGDIILPGMPLSREHKTVEACVPIVSLIPSWDSLYTDGTSGPLVGKELHPNLCHYLSVVSGGRKVISIGTGPKTADVVCIKEA